MKGFDMLTVEEADEGFVEALQGDGQDRLRQGEQGWLA